MANDFNDKQLEAINSSVNKDVLVSASAGSGKTEILSQKVYKVLVEDKIKPEEILVLTFTNKAAYEMKQRIIKTVKSQSNDINLASKLLSAHIQTFDAYSMYLVKTYASRLNLPSNIQIIDSEQINLLKHQFLDDYIKTSLENKDEKMISLISKEDSFSFSTTKELIIEIFDKLYSLSKEDINKVKDITLNSNDSFYFDKYKYFLNNYVDKYYLLPLTIYIYNNIKNSDNLSYDSTINSFIKKFNNCTNDDLLKYCNNNSCSDSWSNGLRRIYLDIIELVRKGSYDSLTSDYVSSLTKRSPKDNPKPSEEKRSILGDISKNYSYLYNLVSSGIKAQLHSINLVKNDIKYIFEICDKLKNRIDEYKKFSNSFEYKDISSFAIKLFDIDEVKEELENKFKFIIVDEYQDTNDEQEKFISKQAKKAHLFLVGDAKQSIYRFRGSKVELFNERRKKLLNSKDGLVIDMNYNYRSIKKVIDDINEIFNNYMTTNKGGVSYDDEKERLRYDYKADLYSDEVFSNTSCHGINIINYKNNNNYADNIAEALTIIQDIDYKVRSKYQIYDIKEKKLRDVTYSDFAILVRRKRSFADYVSVFNKYNIPLENQVEVDLKDMDVFLLIKSLLYLLAIRLKLIEGDELLYFVSVARSYIYGNNSYFTDSKIHEIIFDVKENKDSKLYNESEIIKKIDSIASLYKDNSFIYIFNELIEEFKVLEKLPYIGSILDNVEKVYSLYNKLVFDISSGISFVSFLDKLDKYNKYGLKIKYSSDSSITNSVKLMTLHGSKGLEFPIIYLPVSDNKVDVKKESSTSIVSTKYGVSIPNYYPYLDSTLTKSFLFDLYKSEIDYDSEESENARLYYVLFTRAKESIYIVGNDKPRKGVESLYSLLKYTKHEYNDKTELIKDLVNNNELGAELADYYLITKDLLDYEYNKQKYLNYVNENNKLLVSYYFNNIYDYLNSKKNSIEDEIFALVAREIIPSLDNKIFNDNERKKISSIVSNKDIIAGMNDLLNSSKTKKIVELSKLLLNKLYNIDSLFNTEYVQFNQDKVEIGDLSQGNKINEFSLELKINDTNITTDLSKASGDDIVFKKLEKKKASKELVTSDDISDVLNFGTNVHKVMELIDLKNKDISILDKLPDNLKTLKPKIEKFLSLDILKDLSKSKIYKEYEFYSPINNSKGSIDLLIVNDNSALIIDYKLKNINDEEYNNQLHYYYEEVKRLFNISNIKCYLYSIMDSTLKEVK